MIAEPDGWHHNVVIANDTLEHIKGDYRIWNPQTSQELTNSSFSVEANGIIKDAAIEAFSDERKILLIEWRLDNGVRGVNHYLCGLPAFDLSMYRDIWLPQIALLNNDFDHKTIGL